MTWILPWLLQVLQCPLSTRTDCGAYPSREDKGDDAAPKDLRKMAMGHTKGRWGSMWKEVQGTEHREHSKELSGSTEGAQRSKHSKEYRGQSAVESPVRGTQRELRVRAQKSHFKKKKHSGSTEGAPRREYREESREQAQGWGST